MVSQLLDAVVLDWSGPLTWRFEFDEDDPSGFQADTIRDTGDSGADEFPADPADGFNRFLQLVF